VINWEERRMKQEPTNQTKRSKWKYGGMGAAAAWSLTAAAPAFAHSESGVAGGFLAGFAHPLNGADHLLAMVAVGLWGAFLGRPLIYILPTVFPTVMAGGAILGMAAVELPPIELGIALSVLLLGLLTAAAKSLPIWAASAIVAFFAIFHGFAHGQELPVAADPVGYSAGFVLSTGLLHLLGIALGALTRLPRPFALVPRYLGGLIALAGTYFLYKVLVP
jgi:urease accessory protein